MGRARRGYKQAISAEVAKTRFLALSGLAHYSSARNAKLMNNSWIKSPACLLSISENKSEGRGIRKPVWAI
jgi:hypothetical protein